MRERSQGATRARADLQDSPIPTPPVRLSVEQGKRLDNSHLAVVRRAGAVASTTPSRARAARGLVVRQCVGVSWNLTLTTTSGWPGLGTPIVMSSSLSWAVKVHTPADPDACTWQALNLYWSVGPPLVWICLKGRANTSFTADGVAKRAAAPRSPAFHASNRPRARPSGLVGPGSVVLDGGIAVVEGGATDVVGPTLVVEPPPPQARSSSAPPTATIARSRSAFDGQPSQVVPVGAEAHEPAQRDADDVPEHAGGLGGAFQAPELVTLGAVGDTPHHPGRCRQAPLGDDAVDDVLDRVPVELVGGDGLEHPAGDDPLSGGG